MPFYEQAVREINIFTLDPPDSETLTTRVERLGATPVDRADPFRNSDSRRERRTSLSTLPEEYYSYADTSGNDTTHP